MKTISLPFYLTEYSFPICEGDRRQYFLSMHDGLMGTLVAIVNNHIRDEVPRNWLLDRACASTGWFLCWGLLCCISCPMSCIVYDSEQNGWARAVLAGLEEFKQKHPDAPFEVDFSQGRGANAILFSEWTTVNSIDEYQVEFCHCAGNELTSALLIKMKEGREGEMAQQAMGRLGGMMGMMGGGGGAPPPSNVNPQKSGDVNPGGSPMQMTEGQIRTFCGNCGTQNDSMTKFCGSCGESMSF